MINRLAKWMMMPGTQFQLSKRGHAQALSGWRDVDFFNASLARLRAVYRPAAGETRGGIVGVHPFQALGEQYFISSGLADLLSAAGMAVLLVDLNGLGGSDAGGFDYPGDIVNAGLALQSLVPGRPIGLIAVGPAASWGLCSLASCGHIYEAAVLDTPLRPTQYWSKGSLSRIAQKLLRAVSPSALSWLDPFKRAADLRWSTSIVLIGHADDRYGSDMTARELQSLLRVPSEVLIAPPGSDHPSPITMNRIAGFFSSAMSWESLFNHIASA